jgi:hypothetical protein
VIDSWLPERGWPKGVLEAVRSFRQGHIIPWNSLAYGANFAAAVCKPTSEVGNKGLGYTRIDGPWEHVIITTQTCDICEDGRRKPKMPWISVAPVYDIIPLLSQAGQANQIRTNGFTYLVPLTHTDMSVTGQLWVTDLRIEFPLEKSVLVNQNPIEAFACEADYNDFAEKLAWRRNRPAIDARVRQFVTLPLGAALRNGNVSHEPILEMRLRCGPSWDRVDRAKLYSVVKDGTSIAPIEEQFLEWQESIAETIPADLTLLPTEVIELSALRRTLSLETVLVDYDDVSS